jgi:hypothetical protein
MNFTLGLFDLFTYAVPGSIYLAIMAYVAQAFGWVDVTHARDINSVVLIVAVAIASFMLGHITYPLAKLTEQALRLQRLRALDAKRAFVARNPGSASRDFLQADLFILLAAAELHDKEVATEISRLRAVGLMLRNASLALVFATISALAQLAIGGDRLFATVCVIVFLLATVGAYWQGQTLRHWANTKTLEICALIPDIDEKIIVSSGETSA